MTFRRATVTLSALVLLLAGCSASKSVTTTPLHGRALGASSASSSSSSSSSGRCAYTPPAADANAGAATKDVGTPPAAARAAKATMRITTNLGPIEIALDGVKAPCATGSFAFLAGKHFFDNSKCHRLTTSGIWVLQCGDPSGTGYGGPSYRYDTENTGAPYSRGTVAVANAGTPSTSGSQFFFNYKDNPQISPDYTMLGTVTTGMDVVDKVAAGGITADDPNGAGGGPPKTEIVLQSVTVSYS
ncbi:peptidylprolyl isomerase [Dactylosporangium sp. CA-233914]|uniref:peptidylprolyl isomerase n=1 Tax=Dactylosporangium sp. CA-233914 TaxID=3239934 RepID=UPI003D8C8866